MNTIKFNSDYELYKNSLSIKIDTDTVNLMLHAYCMGYIELTNHLSEEFDSIINIDPVLDKINELNPLIKDKFR